MNTLKIYGKLVSTISVDLGTVVIDLATGLISEVWLGEKRQGAIDMGNRLIFPGLIDLHVHCREDATQTEVYKEDFKTGSEAAINGGVVHIAEMGNNPKPPIDDESYDEKERLASKCPVPVTLYAMIGPTTHPLRRKVPYKMCHARTTGANDLIFFPDRNSIMTAAERYQGLSVSHHCEDSAILKLHESALLHELRRPPEAEISSVQFALMITERLRLRSKICHCSVYNKSITQIVEAKRRGVDVVCEITPHHLYFDTSMITDENRMWMQMNPPLRSPSDRLACIQALRRGEIDILASDHAPHTPEDKRKASGQPHLDTTVPFTTWLMVKQGFRPEDIARVCSAKPAAYLNGFLPNGFGYGYGRIAVGYVGSLTIIDLNSPITISKAHLKTKCGWSPFEGVTFPGRVAHTIIRGKMYSQSY